MSKHSFLSCVFITVVFLTASTAVHADTTPWSKEARLGASFTEVATSRVVAYDDVTGLSGSEESVSWQANFDANFTREYNSFSQEHRINLKYGKVDGVENEDEIDLNNIARLNFVDPTFGYGTARLRSEFDTFAHPANLNLSAGIGSRLLQSENYGKLETRTGPRLRRGWNPSTDWETLYELILEYRLDFNQNNTFTSQLESYTTINDPNDYTVRWENYLTANLNSWLDLRYTFTLYYENPVGEVATKSVTTFNLVYHFYGESDQ